MGVKKIWNSAGLLMHPPNPLPPGEGELMDGHKLTSLLYLGQDGTSNMVPSWDLSGHINDLTSKKIPLTAYESRKKLAISSLG